MNKLINKSGISFVLWGLILTTILFTMPDMGKLVRDKGQAEIDAKYSYSVAQNILKELNDVDEKDNIMDIIMVYHNKQKLLQEDLNKIKEKAANLENNKDKYGIKKILNAFTNKDIEEQVISKDGTTFLLPISVQKQNQTVESIRENIINQLKVDGIENYSTGSDFILEDFVKTVEEGVKKTELITVIFIIAILILVFRSPVTPLATLTTVGLTYLVSKGIVLQMVDKLNFTISNFTNVFLILVLFGIGTDYTMLLLMRFKEEIHNGLDKNTAIIKTYRTAGKTVVLSSLTIFIGFSCLILSQFKVYRSASAVAVGIAVLMIMIFTFLPALMKLLGEHIFWSPFKSLGHADSKVWERVSSLSTKIPHIALLFVIAVCGLIYFHSANLSYNNLKEVGENYPSVKGFNIVSEHFSIGKALPVTIAIKNNEKMDNQYILSELDDITEAVKDFKGVDKVYSVTQPKGERIEELYINDQTVVVKDGLKEASDGAEKINNGLGDAISKIQSKSVDTESINKLQKGAQDMTSSINLINQSVVKLKNGLNSGAQASKNLENGIGNIDDSMGKLSNSMNDLQNAYSALGQGYHQVQGGVDQLLEKTKTFQTAFDGVIALQSQLEAQHPELTTDKTFITMKQTCLQLDSELQNMVEGIANLNSALSTANGSLEKANKGLAQAQSGMEAMKDGTTKLKQGSSTMSSSLAQAAVGQQKVSDAMNKLVDGSVQLANGQNQMIDGIKIFSDESEKLMNGFTDARQGLSDISKGLKDANAYVEKLGKSKTARTFFIPDDKINDREFVKAMDMYMSKDRKITKINIMLDIDPYTEEAMNIVGDINDIVSVRIKASSIKDAEWGISGVSQMNTDLKTMSEKDFKLSSMIMLAGIMIVLFVVTRDFWMSIFIMLSLIASYYVSTSLSGLFFNHILNRGNLTWNVPFFSFIMIIALGVDYSIFLIMRHRENEHMHLTDSIVAAAKSVGGVIFSAGIILSGTFAAMYPSGVLTLMQLSITVIFGILLLCLVFLPVFIPAIVSIKAKIIKKFKVNED
jgi:RND superfamily putative drug exporter